MFLIENKFNNDYFDLKWFYENILKYWWKNIDEKIFRQIINDTNNYNYINSSLLNINLLIIKRWFYENIPYLLDNILMKWLDDMYDTAILQEFYIELQSLAIFIPKNYKINNFS